MSTQLSGMLPRERSSPGLLQSGGQTEVQLYNGEAIASNRFKHCVQNKAENRIFNQIWVHHGSPLIRSNAVHFNAGECLSAATPQRRRLATQLLVAVKHTVKLSVLRPSVPGASDGFPRKLHVRTSSAKANQHQSTMVSMKSNFNRWLFWGYESPHHPARPPQKEKVGWGSMNAQRRKKIWLAKSRQVGPSFCDWDIIGTLSDELLLCFDIRWKRLTWALAEKNKTFKWEQEHDPKLRTWSSWGCEKTSSDSH